MRNLAVWRRHDAIDEGDRVRIMREPLGEAVVAVDAARDVRDARRLLFVCRGNICRSPIAEGVFRAAVDAAGRTGEFTVDSAGTTGLHLGRSPDRRALATASRHGVDLSGMRGRTLRRADFSRFDLILAMDDANLRAIERLRPIGGGAEARLLMSFAASAPRPDIPDPYFSRASAFQTTFDLIDAAIDGLVVQLLGAEVVVESSTASFRRDKGPRTE